MAATRIKSGACKADKNTVKRLNKTIEFLEKQQRGKYGSDFEFILSYLRDIRDGTVPDYVMRSKKN